MKTIVVFGYYDMNNWGDEIFKVFFQTMFAGETLIFLNPDNSEKHQPKGQVDVLIFGGGDLFYEYFLVPFHRLCQRLQPKTVLAIGVGVSDLSLLSSPDDFERCFSPFDHIVLRNRTGKELGFLTSKLGVRRVHYLPDLTFGIQLPKFPTEPKLEALSTPSFSPPTPPPFLASSPFRAKKPRIALSLVQSFCKANPGFLNQVTQTLVSLLPHISRLTLLGFNTDDQNPNESDRVWATKVMTEIETKNKQVVVTYLPLRAGLTETVLLFSRSLDLLIAQRYHAHILATLSATPMFSFNSSRKVKLFVKGEVALSPPFVFETFDNFRDKLSDLLSGQEKLVAERERLFTLSSSFQALWSANSEKVKNIFQPSKIAIEDISRDFYPRLFCFQATDQTVSSKYVYGTIQNLKQGSSVKDLLDYIRKQEFSVQGKPLSINLDFFGQSDFGGLHRFGWDYVVNRVLRAFAKQKDAIICDVFLDRTFGWESDVLAHQNIIPYTSPWIGFLHHGTKAPAEYSPNTMQRVVENPLFVASLPTCCGIICLSEYQRQEFLRLSGAKNPQQNDQLQHTVPTFRLFHPTPIFGPPKWEFKKWEKECCLVSVGAWYRNLWTIFRLETPFPKKVLKAPSANGYYPTFPLRLFSTPEQMLRSDFTKFEYFLNLWVFETFSPPFQSTQIHNAEIAEKDSDIVKQVKQKLSTVTFLETLPNEAYDDLLTRSVVFLDLIEACAVNTVIECIARNTPLVVNRLPSLVEYLGEDYPLFYDLLPSLSELKVKQAHEYLLAHEELKRNISTDFFVSSFSALLQGPVKEAVC